MFKHVVTFFIIILLGLSNARFIFLKSYNFLTTQHLFWTDIITQNIKNIFYIFSLNNVSGIYFWMKIIKVQVKISLFYNLNKGSNPRFPKIRLELIGF